MTVYPTDEAWLYFMEHHDAIRDCVDSYLPIAKMEVPNTRLIDENDRVVIRQSGEEQRGSRPLQVRHSIEDFDDAVKRKDSNKLTSIMNDAWLRLPEDRSIYRERGVTPMCNLLDCTVDGFFDTGQDYEENDKEESAF